MTASIENIVQHLFHQPTLETVSVDELQQMTQEHPSFAAARFLLLKKMQDSEHPDFAGQLHKTAIYFNNPLWLQLLLLPQKEAPAGQFANGHTATPPELPHVEPVQAQEPEPVIQEEVLDKLPENIPETDHAPQEPQQGFQQEPPQEFHEQPATDPLIQEVLDRLRGHIHEAGDIPQEQQEAAPSVVDVPAEIATQDDQPVEEDFAPFPDPEPAPEVQPARTEEPLLIKTIIETPSAQQDLLFEPYHTIDYFASLGIRLDKMEPNPQDKLGKQLRSFTEWLKSMKKLPQASIDKALGENEESAVVAAASHSVIGKDIITEAMAEVFEKQGLNDKAAEVYRKLSLLNPSKSAYFADRINALK